MNKQKIHILDTCYSSLFLALVEDSDSKILAPYTSNEYRKELGDCIYMTCLLLVLLDLDP